MKPCTYSAAEAAQMLGLAKSTLLKHAYAGTLQPKIRFVRAGDAVKFSRVDVDAAVGVEGAA